MCKQDLIVTIYRILNEQMQQMHLPKWGDI